MIVVILVVLFAVLAGLCIAFLFTPKQGPCLDCRDGVHGGCDGCDCPVDHSESRYAE